MDFSLPFSFFCASRWSTRPPVLSATLYRSPLPSSPPAPPPPPTRQQDFNSHIKMPPARALDILPFSMGLLFPAVLGVNSNIASPSTFDHSENPYIHEAIVSLVAWILTARALFVLMSLFILLHLARFAIPIASTPFTLSAERRRRISITISPFKSSTALSSYSSPYSTLPFTWYHSTAHRSNAI